MGMKRRDLLKMFGVAPAIILTPNLLMPVRPMLPPLIVAPGKSTIMTGSVAKMLQEGIEQALRESIEKYGPEYYRFLPSGLRC